MHNAARGGEAGLAGKRPDEGAVLPDRAATSLTRYETELILQHPSLLPLGGEAGRRPDEGVVLRGCAATTESDPKDTDFAFCILQ